MIEKHQQTNGIGRGKITINPEYIKRAGEITVGGQPIKVLSSNPNTGRVLAQFPDGHTEEVKAAPDYFIGGNTSTKELKNNQPIYGETNTAANERADSQDEAHDLTPIFSNLITAGQISTMNEGAQDLQNGKYLEGATKLLSPAMFGSGIGGIAARSGIGGYNLLNKNGVRKTYNLFNQGNYGEGALSLLGDAFNAAMAMEGNSKILNSNVAKEIGARTSGLIDSIKYGVKDRIQGYNLYNKYLKGNRQHLQEQLSNFAPFSGETIISDKTGRLFMQHAPYTRSDMLDTGASIRMGFQAASENKLSKDLVQQGKQVLDKLPTGTSVSADAHGISIPSRLTVNKYSRSPIKTIMQGSEDSETALSNLENKLGYSKGEFIRNPYDMSSDAHRFFTLQAQKPGRTLVYAGRSGKWNNAAVSNPQIYQWQEAYNSGSLSARDYVKNYNNWVKDFGGRPGHVDLQGKPYFYHPTIFITHRQGGKVKSFKKGSGIHIKKKNRGKFTKYCHGKVTDECIQRGKHSSNPTTRKRATFADNARHFKHKDGGKAFVNGVNVLDSNPKMYKYNKKYKMAQEGAKLTFWQQAGNWIKDNQDSISTIGNGISNLISAKNRQDEINQFAQAKQKELKAFKYKTWKDKYLSNLQNQTDRSDIVNAHNAFNQTNINDALQEKQNEINSQIANLQYLNNQQDTGLGDITSGLLGIATNILQGTAKKKKIDNTFSPLANQTMSQIRGKLLDINANFSE